MIDTIAFTLTTDMFRISDPDKFEPSARWVDNASYKWSGIKSKQNPTKKELRAGIYKPRFTLSFRAHANGVREILLRVELSLPKLFFGNNFNELMLKDFAVVNQKLVQVLETMGVIISPKVLANAPVTAVHYSKNIPLTDGSTPYHYIKKIKEANVRLSLDVNQTDYRNDGHSYKWHCNSYEVAFYDKIKDLEIAQKSSKRSLEKDNELQLDICGSLQNRKRLEILRMEARLNKRSKIKDLFKKLGIKADLTFKGLFKPAIAKKVLLHYFDELESKRPALLDYKTSSIKDLLGVLIMNNPDLSPNKIIQMVGLKKIFDEVSPRELRGMFQSKKHARSWFRLIADANKVRLPNAYGTFDVIRECLDTFKSLRLEKI